jgi:hypothetical protein
LRNLNGTVQARFKFSVYSLDVQKCSYHGKADEEQSDDANKRVGETLADTRAFSGM